MPVNAMLIRALLVWYSYHGDAFRVECPTGSGRMMTLYEVAREITNRLAGTFLRDAAGQRPVFGGTRKFQEDPHWRDCVLFPEYFHGENGDGLRQPPDRVDGRHCDIDAHLRRGYAGGVPGGRQACNLRQHCAVGWATAGDRRCARVYAGRAGRVWQHRDWLIGARTATQKPLTREQPMSDITPTQPEAMAGKVPPRPLPPLERDIRKR
jgi:hypothetical protein